MKKKLIIGLCLFFLISCENVRIGTWDAIVWPTQSQSIMESDFSSKEKCLEWAKKELNGKKPYKPTICKDRCDDRPGTQECSGEGLFDI